MTDFGLSKDVITKICNVLAQYPDIESVLVYGSRAKGNYKNGSDIDLTFKGQSLTTDALLKISAELDDLLLPYSFDLSLYHQIDNRNLIEHIDRVAVIFCDEKL